VYSGDNSLRTSRDAPSVSAPPDSASTHQKRSRRKERSVKTQEKDLAVQDPIRPGVHVRAVTDDQFDGISGVVVEVRQPKVVGGFTTLEDVVVGVVLDGEITQRAFDREELEVL